MFRMTGKVYFKNPEEPKKTFFGSFESCSWENSIDQYRNSAEIILPRLYRNPETRSIIPLNKFLKIGFEVKIKCGYDEKNESVFSGFIVAIREMGSKISVQCEGYSYQLKDKKINRTYHKVKLKEVLYDLIKGTDIKLHKDINDFIIEDNMIFRTKRAIDVLEYLRNNCLLSIFFSNNLLYVGLKYIPSGKDIKYRIGWNVIKSDDLVLINNPVTTKIEVSSRRSDGTKIVSTSGTGTILKLKVPHIKDEKILKAIAKDQDKQKNNNYLQGSFETFSKPFAAVFDTAIIENKRNTDQNGKYFISTVKGSFGPGGGRQVIGISIKL